MPCFTSQLENTHPFALEHCVPVHVSTTEVEAAIMLAATVGVPTVAMTPVVNNAEVLTADASDEQLHVLWSWNVYAVPAERPVAVQGEVTNEPQTVSEYAPPLPVLFCSVKPADVHPLPPEQAEPVNVMTIAVDAALALAATAGVDAKPRMPVEKANNEVNTGLDVEGQVHVSATEYL